MHYEGSTKLVEQIRQELQANATCFKRKRKDYDDLFGIKNIVVTEVYDILLIGKARVYLFPIRFVFDGRDGTAMIDIKDGDKNLLCKASPSAQEIVSSS